jgi:hypothetical protein
VILGRDISHTSGKGVLLAGDCFGEVRLCEGWGEVDEVCYSDRCNIVVICVFSSNMFIGLFTLGGLNNTRRFAYGEVISVVIVGIILKVAIGVEWMLSGVNEFLNRFVKILIALSDVLCLPLLALKA